jgi:holin-like protein
MDTLRGLALLLLCQSAGEALSRAMGATLPGPVIGLLLLWGLLQWPAVRAPVAAAAEPLMQHLSLLFVPVGVGVVTHLSLVGQFGGRMLAALVLSTWAGMAVAAWVLRACWPADAAVAQDHA